MATVQLPENIKMLMYSAAKVATSLHIQDISLEVNNKGTMIRGFTNNHGSPVIINHVYDLTLPFQSFAINDCKQFIARYDLAESQDSNFDSTMVVDGNTNKVTTLAMKNSKGGKRFSLEFNTGNADTVRAPKGVKDTIIFNFELNSDLISNIDKSIRAMGGEDVTIIFDGTELSYEIKTGAKDVFKSVISVIDNDNNQPAFAYSYPFSALKPSMTLNDTNTFGITTRGLLHCNLKGMTVYLLPRM